MAEHWRYRLGLLLVSASAVAWSTAGYFTRLIPLDTGTTLFWRGLFGALGILLFIGIFKRGGGMKSFRAMGAPGWAFALVSAVGMLCFVAALKRTSVAHVAIVYATVPLLAAGLAWLVLREKASKSALAARVAALAGVSLMVGLGQEGTFAGDLLAFAMTSSMAIIMVIARRYQGIPMLPAACVSAVLSALAAVPFAELTVPNATSLVQLALFGLVNSALGLALFAFGSKMLPAAETALIGALDAPLAPLWVLWAFDERPSLPTVVGGGIVFAAILLHLAWTNRPKTPP